MSLCEIEGCKLKCVKKVRYCTRHKCGDQNCMNKRSTYSLYCDEHRCEGCRYSKLPLDMNCGRHACTEPGCVNIKINSDATYCHQHDCHFSGSPYFICPHRRSEGKIICDNHKCTMAECENYHEIVDCIPNSPYKYCTAHKISIQQAQYQKNENGTY
jgi:hypothetical protein